MTTPALILSIFLPITFCGEMFRIARTTKPNNDASYIIGRVLGTCARFSTIFACLIMGGFYN